MRLWTWQLQIAHVLGFDSKTTNRPTTERTNRRIGESAPRDHHTVGCCFDAFWRDFPEVNIFNGQDVVGMNLFLLGEEEDLMTWCQIGIILGMVRDFRVDLRHLQYDKKKICALWFVTSTELGKSRSMTFYDPNSYLSWHLQPPRQINVMKLCCFHMAKRRALAVHTSKHLGEACVWQHGPSKSCEATVVCCL